MYKNKKTGEITNFLKDTKVSFENNEILKKDFKDSYNHIFNNEFLLDKFNENERQFIECYYSLFISSYLEIQNFKKINNIKIENNYNSIQITKLLNSLYQYELMYIYYLTLYLNAINGAFLIENDIFKMQNIDQNIIKSDLGFYLIELFDIDNYTENIENLFKDYCFVNDIDLSIKFDIDKTFQTQYYIKTNADKLISQSETTGEYKITQNDLDLITKTNADKIGYIIKKYVTTGGTQKELCNKFISIMKTKNINISETSIYSNTSRYEKYNDFKPKENKDLITLIQNILK